MIQFHGVLVQDSMDSGIEKKSGKDIRVIIESKSEMESSTWGSGSLASSSSISEKW